MLDAIIYIHYMLSRQVHRICNITLSVIHKNVLLLTCIELQRLCFIRILAFYTSFLFYLEKTEGKLMDTGYLEIFEANFERKSHISSFLLI